MQEQASLLGVILLVLGIPGLILLEKKLGFRSGAPVRHQRTHLFRLAAGVLFTVVIILFDLPDFLVIKKALLVATPSLLVGIWWTRRNYQRNVEGDVLKVVKRPGLDKFVTLVLIILAVTPISDAPMVSAVLDANWLFLGIALAWLVTTLYAYGNVSRIERELGRPLLEVESSV